MKINPSVCLERHILQNKITTVSDKKISTIDIPACLQLIAEVPDARKSAAFIEISATVEMTLLGCSTSTERGERIFINSIAIKWGMQG